MRHADGTNAATMLAAAIAEADLRVRPLAAVTPLVAAERASKRLGVSVLLKLETLQPTGSFKLRGAANKLARLGHAERRPCVVAASTGNHGLAVAYAGRALGHEVRVHAPRTADAGKLAGIEALGAELVLGEGDCLAAETRARRDAEARGATFVSPYNDLDVVAGQGTCGLEMTRAGPALDAVFVAVGGGGLVAGIAAAFAAWSPKTRIIGCQPIASQVMAQWAQGGAEVPEAATYSDATAGMLERDTVTLPLCQALVHDWVRVSEAEIAAAFRSLIDEEHLVVEGAAAVALAALHKERHAHRGARVAVVLCGRNVGTRTMRAMLDA